MQVRALIILGVALILGGVTVFLVNTYLQQEVSGRTSAQTIETVPVVVAAVDLKTGVRLEKIKLAVAEWPKDSAPQDFFSSIDVVLGEEPPVVLREIRTGEAVLPYKLSPHGARGGLPAMIPEDKRAITIGVNEVRGVAGFVSPGDYVDILHTSSVGRSDKIPVTRMLLQNIKVLGVDQVSSQDETDPKIVNAVTLLVTPSEGQKVTLAAATGDVNLILRNELDASILATSEVSYKDLQTLDTRRVTRVVKRARRRPRVEVIRGLEVTNQAVKEGEPTTSGTTGTQPAAGQQ